MREDKEGFLYPVVDEQLCRKCRICITKCPVLSPRFLPDTQNVKPLGYAYINEGEVRNNSSSGGFFHTLSEYVLRKRGVVFGAAFNKNWVVEHQVVKTIENINKLQTSKYSQSRIGATYRKVKEYLDKGIPVLFTGTPCQCEGLLSYLPVDYGSLLITADVICHGVPSPIVWKKYLSHSVNGNIDHIDYVSFRDKSISWIDYSVTICLRGASNIKHRAADDLYMKGFLQNITLRLSCYECRFNHEECHTDFTLGDYWGVESLDSDMFDNMGTSLVIIHNEKSYNIFKDLKGKKKRINLSDAIKTNPAYYKPALFNPKRGKFFAKLERGISVDRCLYEFTKPPLITRIKQFMKRIAFIKHAYELLKR